MNRLIVELIMAGCLLASGIGLYYVVSENGKLENENENLVATVANTQEAIFSLGTTITNLQTEYSKATSDEFKKFNETDISQIPMDKLVRSFNIGTKRVFKDYRSKTTEFVRGDTETTSP